MDLRFAVCTFKRIYDTDPIQEVVSLEQLTTVLTHFALKEKLHAKSLREIKRIEEAWQAWQAGTTQSGKKWSRLSRAHKEAPRFGRAGEHDDQSEISRRP